MDVRRHLLRLVHVGVKSSVITRLRLHGHARDAVVPIELPKSTRFSSRFCSAIAGSGPRGAPARRTSARSADPMLLDAAADRLDHVGHEASMMRRTVW
jgi:hypothetical protein